MSRAAALIGSVAAAAGASLAMSYTPVTSATYNVAYTGATPVTTGGTAPYTYSSVGSALPTGITLNSSTGILSGTDSTDSGGAAYTGIQIRVTDSAGSPAHIDSSTFTITVAAAAGSFALVAHQIGAGDNFTAGTTSAINTSGANLIVVTQSSFWNAETTLSDSEGNTWTSISPRVASSNGNLLEMFYCYNPTVGSGHTFTSTPVGGASTYPSLTVAAFSGAHSAPLDTHGVGFGSSTAPQAASITPSAINGLVIAVAGYGIGSPDGGTVSGSPIDGGFTLLDANTYSNGHHQGLAMAYLIQTSAVAAHPAWSLTASREWTALATAFKAA